MMILDEGIPGWADQGYPIAKSAEKS